MILLSSASTVGSNNSISRTKTYDENAKKLLVHTNIGNGYRRETERINELKAVLMSQITLMRKT